MRLELRNVLGLDDEWQVWLVIDGSSAGKAYMRDGAYHVARRHLPPEFEPMVRDLEDGPGSRGPLAPGEIRGIDAGYPTPAQIARARSGPPPYRPEPET